MRLGILAVSGRHLAQIRGITRAALRSGHRVTIFATGEGARLLARRTFSALSDLEGVSISYCDSSLQRWGGRPRGLPESIAAGSQFENAVMAAASDRIIVL